jgi:hypothetical protein
VVVAAAPLADDRTHHPPRRLGHHDPVSELGITHFVDDRLEVLSYLDAVPNRYLFRPRADEVDAHRRFLAYVQVVDSWTELVQAIGDHRT